VLCTVAHVRYIAKPLSWEPCYHAWHVKAGAAIIDGEVVVPAADGTTDFSVLQNELKGSSKSIVLVAFYLLY
jgi:ATP-dependent DNA ligase